MSDFITNWRNSINKELENIRKIGAEQQQKIDSVVNNTFQTGEDGINYGKGDDGLTYSYTIKNDKVSDFKPLSANEQRDAIEKITGGRVVVGPEVTNQQSLTDIFRSVSRMYNNGGNLVPEATTIQDMFPGAYVPFGAPGGIAYNGSGKTRDVVELNGMAFPEFRKGDEEYGYAIGASSNNKNPGEYVPTHELSHTAQYTADRTLNKWMNNALNEANEQQGKYPVDELFKKAVSDFFGQGYEMDPSKEISTQMTNAVYDKYNKWVHEDRPDEESFFQQAAKKAGFDSVANAAKTISGYAGKVYPYSYKINGKTITGSEVSEPEIFAEAYTDVLMNGEDAARFSKELISLYSDYADKWADRTGVTKSKNFKAIQDMLDLIPDKKYWATNTNGNLFNQNFRFAFPRNRK
jgi:hypothetical protein